MDYFSSVNLLQECIVLFRVSVSWMALIPVKGKKALPSSISILFPQEPNCQHDWHNSLEHVKSRFLKGHWKDCVSRCQHLLSAVPNPVSRLMAPSKPKCPSDFSLSRMACAQRICTFMPRFATNQLVEQLTIFRTPKSRVLLRRKNPTRQPPMHSLAHHGFKVQSEAGSPSTNVPLPPLPANSNSAPLVRPENPWNHLHCTYTKTSKSTASQSRLREADPQGVTRLISINLHLKHHQTEPAVQ